MTRAIELRGYPEAVLATNSVTLDLSAAATASGVVGELAASHPQLRDALLGPDGTPRKSIKVLTNGALVGHKSPVPSEGALTVLATLPCDG